MTFFLIFAISSKILTQDSDCISFSRYQAVEIENLAKNPSKYEGKEISSEGIVKVFVFNETSNQQVIEIQYGLKLRCQKAEGLKEGMKIYFRGRCLIISKGFIDVRELHVSNINSEILSIPGLAAFVSLFFFVYKIDWKLPAFVSRRKGDA